MAIHGKDTAFSLEDSAGTTLRIIDPYLNDVHDVTPFGAEGHLKLVGLTDGTINLTGFWDKTADVGLATVLDSLVGLDNITLAWEYGPEGRTAGLVKYSGECVLETVDHSSPVADIVTTASTLQISGNVTKGVWS